MAFSAIIPVADMATANAALEAQGHGSGCFSVPLNDGADATHAGMHSWTDGAFRMHVAAISGVVVRDDGADDARDAFEALATAQALAWEEPTNWHLNPVMTGDQRAYGGKTWESLIDFNVWAPPVGWREVVAEGYPDWVQPTGAHDAYNTGDRVTFEGADYESLIDANVWSPTAYPAGWQLI